jgi:1,4-alpha-glucan branching enzyme
MSETSFRQCVIDWEAGAKPEHAAWCSLYRRLLQRRRELLVPRLPAMPAASPGVFAETGLALRWRLADATSLCLLANLGPETLTSELPGMTGGQLLHAEPESASTAGSSLPPWSVIWRLQEPR